MKYWDMKVLHYILLFLRPPLQKSPISKKTSKSSFYYRKMQQSLLFQNIYNFLKKDQVLTDFWSQHWAYPPIFSNKSEVFSCEFLLSKKSNLILLHWQLPFILHYFLLVFSYFLDCHLSLRRVPLGSENIFCHRCIRNCDSSIELSVLITNITFFK